MNNIEIITFEKVSIDYYHLLAYDKKRSDLLFMDNEFARASMLV